MCALMLLCSSAMQLGAMDVDLVAVVKGGCDGAAADSQKMRRQLEVQYGPDVIELLRKRFDRSGNNEEIGRPIDETGTPYDDRGKADRAGRRKRDFERRRRTGVNRIDGKGNILCRLSDADVNALMRQCLAAGIIKGNDLSDESDSSSGGSDCSAESDSSGASDIE